MLKRFLGLLCDIVFVCGLWVARHLIYVPHQVPSRLLKPSVLDHHGQTTSGVRIEVLRKVRGHAMSDV